MQNAMQNAVQRAIGPISDIYQTQLEASRRLAEVVFSGTERLDHATLEATRRAITDQLNFAQAVVATRDPNGVADVQANYMSRRPDNAMNYQREIVRIFAEVQSEIGQSLQYYMEQVGSAVANNVPNMVSNAQDQGQAQGGGNFNPVTGIFSMWETMFREVSTIADRNMAAARSSFENMANVTTDAMQRGAHMAGQAAQNAASTANGASYAAGESVASEEKRPSGKRR